MLLQNKCQIEIGLLTAVSLIEIVKEKQVDKHQSDPKYVLYVFARASGTDGLGFDACRGVP